MVFLIMCSVWRHCYDSPDTHRADSDTATRGIKRIMNKLSRSRAAAAGCRLLTPLGMSSLLGSRRIQSLTLDMHNTGLLRAGSAVTLYISQFIMRIMRSTCCELVTADVLYLAGSPAARVMALMPAFIIITSCPSCGAL